MPAVMMRPDSGTKARTASTDDVNKHIADLQQQLTKSKAETRRARDKLNCLISLIRRSWNGDRNALLHLSNIVGMEAPVDGMDGLEGRPASMMQTGASGKQSRAERNWERLTVRLLQLENDLIVQELREHQARYIENRSRYMDEVLLHHHHDMARLPAASTQPVSTKQFTLEEVDRSFLKQHKRPVLQAKSAAQQRRNKKPREVVQVADVKLRDLFVQSSSPPQADGDSVSNTASKFAPDASLAGLTAKEKEVVKKARSMAAYDDTKRYLQGNLYSAEQMVPKKPRPFSAAVLRERDTQRSRPRSASSVKSESAVFLTQVSGRPVKYETTRPVSSKPLRKKSMDKSADGSHVTFTTQPAPVEDSSGENVPPSSPQEYVLPAETVEDILAAAQAQAKPPISVQVKNALRKPESVNRLVNDLKKMEEMEELFQKDTKALQKRLGLPDEGLV